MAGDSLSRRVAFLSWRLVIGGGLFVLTLAAVGWWAFCDGIPVLWGPTASAAEVEAGRELFEREWSANDPLAAGDGLGPVFNAKSCVACHSQGGTGGGGSAGRNAVHFEVLPQPGKNEYVVGVLHADGVTASDRETMALLRKKYPITTFPVPPPPPPPPPPRPGEHCEYTPPAGGWTPPPKPPFDPLRTHSVQPTALFGAGWIDRIPTRAITRNADRRGAKLGLAEISGDFSGVPVGRVPYTADGRVGKFGWKGDFATLKEFVAAACANELGLGTSHAPQAKPLHKTTADAPHDLTDTQFGQLVAFVDTLPRPVEVSSPTAERGKELFAAVGCAACHVPDVGGVKGVYSDFLLYTIEDKPPNGGEYGRPPIPAENARPEGKPAADEWKTPALWGVADSAPYLHDGSAPTLAVAIARHQGDAKGVTAAYQKLPDADRAAVIAFLESLKAPPDASPAPAHAVEKKRK